MAEFAYVGRSVPKVDARAKVLGKTKFVSEEGIGFPGMLYGKVLFSPHAHARIVKIDTSKAAAVRGVRAVLTGKDVPETRVGMLIDDRHILCREIVRFVGDPVACVAAESEDAAAEAVRLIEVEYEILPAIFDAEAAMAPDCPVVIHPDLPAYNRPLYAYMGKDLPGPNVHTHHKVRKGDVDRAFAEADFIVENRYECDRITHCQMEPYNSVCYPQTDGTATVWTSARLHETHDPLLQAFGLNPSQLRTRTSYQGGMFGMIGRPERFTLLLAQKTGRPVKMVYTREENFIEGLNRLAEIVYVKDGLKKDGTIVAREIKGIVNTGAYTHHGPLVIRNGAFHASQYRLPNYRWDAYGIYTNTPACGPLRGFGSAEVIWATEQHMDLDARAVGMDPIEFRLLNTPDAGERDVRGTLVTCIGAKRCLKIVSDRIEWGEPSDQPAESHIKVGKGIALANKYSMADTASSVILDMKPDGVLEISHGGDDCGQGLNTVLTQIAAEQFSVPMEMVRIVWGDSWRSPYDFGTASSRSTLYIGNALIKACDDAKRQIRELAAKKLGMDDGDIEVGKGGFWLRDNPEKVFPMSFLSLANHPEARGTVKGATCLEESAGIRGTGVFWGHPGAEDPETGQGERLAISYSYGAQAAEVAVDTETGVVKILRLYSAFDTGKTMHPTMCEAQHEGGMVQGIGSALYEGFIFDEAGVLMNPNLHDYKVCSTGDVPSGDDLWVALVEDPHPEGPYGAKGTGESAMCPTASAVANAIYNAVGVRLTQLPMTPERVLAALKEQRGDSRTDAAT
ncbi:MAG: xanthine dehydrogenase family protein molybdopterin-binding subunit [Actinobacteria bacterium]|nr:xanthine dehydrogenase family protein molybdopterin-binding subunit [Actinomycetota bacterium]